MEEEKSSDSDNLELAAQNEDLTQTQCKTLEEDDDEETDSQSRCEIFTLMTSEQKITVITFCICNVTVSSFYGMIAPFFPAEASRKGTSPVCVGFIFAIFQGTIALTSPIFGSVITRVGAKRMYASGILLCGMCSILFGSALLTLSTLAVYIFDEFLNHCPDGTIFICMCLFMRFLQGLGASAFFTANDAILAAMFPKNFATIFGSLEFFMGLGVTVGPVLGGSLHQIGGYMLPFATVGAAVLAVGLFSIYFLPKYVDAGHNSKGSLLNLVKIPLISLVGFCLFCGTATFGFAEVTLSSFLINTFEMSEVEIGFVFLLLAGSYAFSGPIWGFLSDKYTKWTLRFIMLGCFMTGLFLHFIGPAPFIYIPHTLWLHLISVGFMGCGVASLLLSFPFFVKAALEKGYPNDLATFGLCSGLFNTCFSTGTCVGPIVGGILVSQLSFEAAAALVGECVIVSGLILMIYIICMKKKQDYYKEVSSDTSRRPSTISQFSQITEISKETQLLSNTTSVLTN